MAGDCCCVGSLTEVLPGWVIALLSAAAIALLIACVASGLCEAAAVTAAIGAALALVVIGALQAAGIEVSGGSEGTSGAAEQPSATPEGSEAE